MPSLERYQRRIKFNCNINHIQLPFGTLLWYEGLEQSNRHVKFEVCDFSTLVALSNSMSSALLISHYKQSSGTLKNLCFCFTQSEIIFAIVQLMFLQNSSSGISGLSCSVTIARARLPHIWLRKTVTSFRGVFKPIILGYIIKQDQIACNFQHFSLKNFKNFIESDSCSPSVPSPNLPYEKLQRPETHHLGSTLVTCPQLHGDSTLHSGNLESNSN